ncbi:Type III restriction-modification system, restriction subunit [Latilactobacillus curvatus]|uniref:DEAD/DEAH box helicase family protein n=1 Tax=Latilactobacillus curvatus TaxID=28038 RepID=UPI000A1ACD03|nr:DEAD/DEAH box helicase family protein [Latilactobacillus curvatus]SMH68808.1 Type III restriction-modification system, restriction subunit [Latilactobacillus curvatus]
MADATAPIKIQVKSSNFEFMKLDTDLSDYYKEAELAELDFLHQDYNGEYVKIRKITENITSLILNSKSNLIINRNSFDENIKLLSEYIDDEKIFFILNKLRRLGNTGAHTVSESDEETALMALKYLKMLLYWYLNTFKDFKVQVESLKKPELMPIKPVLAADGYADNFERTMIYIQTADNSNGMWPAYEGAEKIGETTAPREDVEQDWRPNSDFLRMQTQKRLNGYMKTAGVPAVIDWAELAYIKGEGSKPGRWFNDKTVHEVLKRSGYKHQPHLEGTEWFHIDLESAKAAIKAVKDGKLTLDQRTNETEEIVLRPEQVAAVEQAQNSFKKNNKTLWNAKMRFGKTLSTYELIKKERYQKVLIMTHRPVVADSWFEDFRKIKMTEAGYTFGSKDKGESIDFLINSQRPFVYFASIQNLRGSSEVGGKYDKNQDVFTIDWDLIVIDEAHEGTQTKLAKNLNKQLIKENTKILELSGTPFNILNNFSEDQVFTWDYIMEQQAKIRFNMEHPDSINPYEQLPEVEMYTFKMAEANRFKTLDKYFDFAEFFRINNVTNQFEYSDAIEKWLDQITNIDSNTAYPFSTKEYRNTLRHTMWLLPSRAAAKELKKMLQRHPVFGEYNILNIVDENDNDVASTDDMERVHSVITDHPSRTKTIILTVRKLTTGVNIPELSAVIFLNNTTSAQNYLQAAFRAQTPFSDEFMGMKRKAYIFDFAPDRALNIMAKSVSMSTKKSSTGQQQEKLEQLMNFLPIIGQSGNRMETYSISTMMRQLKKAYAEKAVLSGFDDSSIYSDDLWKITAEEATVFNELSGKIGTTNQSKKLRKVLINNQGLDNDELDKVRRTQHKTKKIRTPEDNELLEKQKEAKRNRDSLIAILRGISIRIPLMIYGMDARFDEKVTIDDFVNQVDEVSWQEFMPKGVTKHDFSKIKKFYDPDIFIEAGYRIRQAAVSADKLGYQERIDKITTIFSGFKNPDKETVLTPWRVVNMQLGETLGGYNFFDENYPKSPNEKGNIRYINKNTITNEIFSKDSKILEINSKTGLYPLYMAFTLYKKRFEKESGNWRKSEWVQNDKALWEDILIRNIYVLNKTPMARMITYRTLNGYNINKKVFSKLIVVSELISKLQNSIPDTIEEIKKKFGDGEMKFDVVVGNPPYMEKRGNYNLQIHYDFLKMAYVISSGYISLLHPLNWLNDPKTLSTVKSNLQYLHRYSDSTRIFQDVSIPSGVGFELINKKETFEKTIVIEKGIEEKIDITGNFNVDDIRIKDEINNVGFKLNIGDRLSDYVGFLNSDKTLQENKEGDVFIWYKKSSGKSGNNVWMRVSRSDIPAGKIIDEYKVMISKDGHAERSENKPENIFNNKAMVLKPGQITTDRPYLLTAKNKKEAELLAEYANSKFFRRILHIQDKASSVPKSAFFDIPDIAEWENQYRPSEWNNIDQFLNNYYKLSEETQLDIASRIAEK